jgi:hypothetical protein
LKDVHPRFRKLAGIGPVAPVLLHQSRLSTADGTERDDENKIETLRKRKNPAVRERKQDLVESGEKSLWAMQV